MWPWQRWGESLGQLYFLVLSKAGSVFQWSILLFLKYSRAVIKIMGSEMREMKIQKPITFLNSGKIT